jgi:EAL domain-containing protein (putative c-di-GMP-specific phosphodiesterase class I)
MKIDRSFIMNVPATAERLDHRGDHRDGQALKLRVIAEGVENRAQLDFLRANHCEAFQGFLFSRPITALEATAMLRAQALAPSNCRDRPSYARPSSARAAGSARGSA